MQDDVADRIQQVVDLQNQSQTIFTLFPFLELYADQTITNQLLIFPLFSISYSIQR